MAYPAFPAIQKPSFQYDVTPEDPGICSQMSDGSAVSRARFTKSRLSFGYRWNAMPAADRAALLNFYRNIVRGSALIFTWIDPDPDSEFYNKTFNVRFKSGCPPKFTKAGPGRFSVEVVFEEA